MYKVGIPWIIKKWQDHRFVERADGDAKRLEIWRRKQEELKAPNAQNIDKKPIEASGRKRINTLKTSTEEPQNVNDASQSSSVQLLYEFPESKSPQDVIREQWASKQKEIDEERIARLQKAEQERIARQLASKNIPKQKYVSKDPAEEDLESVLTPQELLRRVWGQKSVESPPKDGSE